MKEWLAARGPRFNTAFAVTAAFVTYFCMYAFRKPFAAATFAGEGVPFFGTTIELKTLYVVSQIFGYAMSKFIGIRVCSQTGRNQRFTRLVGLILAAETALVLFALAPADAPWLRSLAIFGNGLPLGMVWGIVVLYLEGRRASEVLMTGLSCSFIVASGVVKDVGRALLAGAAIPLPGISPTIAAIPNPFPAATDYWMPALTGILFFPPLLVSAWLLDQTPPPSEEDIRQRIRRVPMDRSQRNAFLRRYAVGIIAAVAAYVVLTGFRDYRDTYAVEVFNQLGYDYESNQSVISQAELIVAFGVMLVLSQLFRIEDNRRALAAIYAIMACGLLLAGGTTLLLDAQAINGFWWMTLVGLGAYLAYVPFNSVLFDRVIASTGFVGTAVFGIYVADAAGYLGTVGLLLGKDTLLADFSPLAFMRWLSYVLATAGVASLLISCIAFLRTQPTKVAHPGA